MRRVGIATGVAVLASLGLAASANAATITVDSLADDGTNCTLREAIDSANANSDQGGCSGAGAYGDDTIQFSNSLTLPGTITLTGGQLSVISGFGSVDIVGPGVSQLTVSGNNSSRVFQVNSGAVAAISGAKITGGSTTGTMAAGAGIRNLGTLSLNRVSVTQNNAAASDTMNVSNRDAFAGGAGIHSTGTLGIEFSSIANNQAIAIAASTATLDASAAAVGGGIWAQLGTVSVFRSTIEANSVSASAIGPGINFDSASGGALYTPGVAANIKLSTISDNDAAASAIPLNGRAGGVTGDANTNLTSDTITGNSHSSSAPGASVFGVSNVNLENTIVDNTSAVLNCANTVSAGHNLADDASCNLGGTGDQPSTEPNLLGLGDYGGPTRTNPPEPPSMATPTTVIDKGVAASQATDQRALQRTWEFDVANPASGDGTDIGAVEIQGPSFTGISPPSPGDDASPEITGRSEPGSMVQLYSGFGCGFAAGPATGAAGFAAPGITVGPFAADSYNAFQAKTQYGNAFSICAAPLAEYIRRPTAPVLTSTDPPSGSDNNSPLIKGTTTTAGLVTLYTDAACTGSSVGGGPSATLAGAGIPLTTPVPDNSTTTFYAKLEGTNANSSCSATGLTYNEVTPPPTTTPPTSGPPAPASAPNLLGTGLKKCKKGRKLKRGRCVKKKKK